MINKLDKRMKKAEDTIKLANTPDKDIEKMDYKQKQKVFKAKSKVMKIFHVSKGKNDKGITYIKQKNEDKK